MGEARAEHLIDTESWRTLAEALDAFADVALDIDALLEVIARRTAEVVGDVALVTLLSEDGTWLRPAAVFSADPVLTRGYRAMLEAAPGRAGEGRAGQVIATNTPLLVANVEPEALVASTRPEWREVARRLDVHSLMIVPMRVRGIPIGSFSLVRSRAGVPYGPREQALLQGVADRGALAVANARAHAALKDRLARSEREAEKRDVLRDLFDAMPQLGWTARPDGFIDYYNRGWYEYTGTTREQMEGWGWQSVHDPDLLPHVMDRWKATLESGIALEMDIRLRRHDGAFRTFLTRVNPQRDAEGKVVRWVGVNTDIEDQKRLEANLAHARDDVREERNRFRALLDNLPVTVSFLMGDDLVVEYAHPNTVRVLGREIEGKPLLEAVPEHRGHPFVDKLRHVLRTGEIHEQREALIPIDRHNTGQIENTYWTTLYQPIRRRDGSIEGVMTFDQDVTHSSAVEERFRVLVNSVKDYAIVILDDHGRVTTWNAGAARIHGYEAAAIVGKHFSVFYPEEEVARGACDRDLQRALRDGRSEDEGWRTRKDGSRLWANMVLTPLRDRNGSPIGFAKVTRDLTERREGEEKLQRLAAERATFEEKARLQEFQERFLAILGHDLRNPLAAIDMGAAVLRERAAKTKDASGARMLDRMTASSRRMGRMIEQILDLTRSRLAGGLEMNPASMDLADTLTRVVDELKLAHPARTLVLRSPPLRGYWDRDRLEQVFSNLIGNAVHYGLPEKAVTIEGGEEAGAVWIEVHNDGAPIADELMTSLFSPFRRGDRESRRALTAGLGLGLYISRQIAIAHGGAITVKSTASAGTTFRVTLPRPTSAPPLQ